LVQWLPEPLFSERSTPRQGALGWRDAAAMAAVEGGDGGTKLEVRVVRRGHLQGCWQRVVGTSPLTVGGQGWAVGGPRDYGQPDILPTC
jgi:hypothetical protein